MSIPRTVRPAGAVSVSSDVGAGRAPNGVAMNLGPGGAKGWSPTVANLLVLVVLEIVAFSVIRYAFKRISG